jgi:predicted MFS family arabinose efflux permease
LLGGVVADTYDSRRVMLVTRAALALTAFAAATLVAAGQIATGHLLLYVLLVVGLAAIDMPVARTHLFAFVGGPRVLSAYALQSVIMNTITVFLALSAGLLIGLGGPEAAFLLLAVGYAVSLLLLLKTPASARAEAAKGTNPLADVIAGIAYVRATPAVAALVALAFLVPVAGIYFAMVPVFAREVLDVGAGGLGMLVASFSAGGLLGSVWLTARAGMGRRSLTLTLLGLAFGAGMIAFALSQSFWLSCVISLVMGLLAAFWQNILGTLLQVVAAPEMRGRVTSVYTMGFQLVGLGWLVGGSVAAVASVQVAVLLGGAVFTGMSLAIYALSPEVRQLD